jgi:hypothetical protein
VGVSLWGFKSPLPHHLISQFQYLSFHLLLRNLVQTLCSRLPDLQGRLPLLRSIHLQVAVKRDVGLMLSPYIGPHILMEVEYAALAA